MAAFVDRPVLRFRASEEPGRYAQLLWPAYGWRVVAPRAGERKLDIFERAVLGLCRAGVHHRDTVADRLVLGSDLVAHLLVSLQRRGLIDIHGQPTVSGLKMLEADLEAPAEEPIVGTVFSDPFDGKLWPRFVTGELPYAEAEPGEGGHLDLVVGTRGAPRRVRVFSVYEPFGALCAAPTATEILAATRAHRARAARQASDRADAPWIRQIGLVDEHPTPFWLFVRVRMERGRMVADDPFGVGESPLLRERMEEQLEIDENLRLFVQRRLGNERIEVDFEVLQAEAERRIEDRLSLAIRKDERLFRRLVAMQRAGIEVEQEGAPPDKWEDLAVKAQQTLERLVRNLLDDPEPILRASLARDDTFNTELVNAVAADLGFRTPLPESLSRVRRGKVLNALESGRGSLRPLVLAALLGARGVPNHPLRRAARAAPDLLARLDRAASLRDPASHDSDAPIRPGEVRMIVEDVLVITRLLAGEEDE